jgi:hypothetical protein
MQKETTTTTKTVPAHLLFKEEYQAIVAQSGITDPEELKWLHAAYLIDQKAVVKTYENMGKALNSMSLWDKAKFWGQGFIVFAGLGTATALGIGMVSGRRNKRKQAEAPKVGGDANPFENPEAAPRPIRKTL